MAWESENHFAGSWSNQFNNCAGGKRDAAAAQPGGGGGGGRRSYPVQRAAVPYFRRCLHCHPVHFGGFLQWRYNHGRSGVASLGHTTVTRLQSALAAGHRGTFFFAGER